MDAAGRANGFGALRRLARRPRRAEGCEFCNEPLAAEHRHLLDLASRRIVCVCGACALRFEGAVSRWRLIPRDARRLADMRLTAAQWNAFALPIELAFFFHSTPAGKVMALYPSPGGAVESLLPLPTWEALVRDNPALADMAPDVEALLVNRLGTACDCYIAPIDACFELVGLIRLHWRGLGGGEEARREIDGFFDRLAATAAGQSATAHA